MEIRPRRVGIRCDVGSTVGLGHLMRCASLAEELLARGWSVEFCSDAESVPLAVARIAELGCDSRSSLSSVPEHLEWVATSSLDLVIIDSYVLDAQVSRVLTEVIPTLAIIDGAARGQSASLYIDQNFGAEQRPWPSADVPQPAAQRLAGTEYALIADRFRRLRPATAQHCAVNGELKVVVALGGTDAMELGEAVATTIGECPIHLDVTVVSDRLALSPPPNAGSSNAAAIQFVAPSLDFPRWLAAADLVVSAAGSSLWELCCLGKPVAAVAVAQNQVEAYDRLVDRGVILGLGNLTREAYSSDGVAKALTSLLGNAHLRAKLATRAFNLVDGDGRVRVVNALEQLMETENIA